MARRKQFGQLTERNREKIAQDASRYGLTRRQARERYNRGTYNPLARTPGKQIPQKAPYYPVESGSALKRAAIANLDAKLTDHVNRHGEIANYNRFAVLDAIEHHASDEALRRMANASEDELESWAEYQRKYSFTYKQGARKGTRQFTPEQLRSLGWYDDEGWHNVFWYHLWADRRTLYLRWCVDIHVVYSALRAAVANSGRGDVRGC